MADSTATKYCRSCGQTTPATEFGRDRGASQRTYNAAHRDELCAYYRDYCVANGDHLRTRQHNDRLNHQGKIAGKKAVQGAIQHGIFPRPQTWVCAVCGGQAAGSQATTSRLHEPQYARGTSCHFN